MMKDSTAFIAALEANDLEALRKLPKADVHHHSALGYKFFRLQNSLDRPISSPPKRMRSIEEMGQYIVEVLRPHYSCIADYRRALEWSFVEAREDGVRFLEMSFDTAFLRLFDGDIMAFIEMIQQLHKSVAPDIVLSPEIGIDRELPLAQVEAVVFPLIDSGFFTSIDLYGNELKGDIYQFRPLYAYARQHGLKCKAHAGEFGSADFVKESVEVLELDQVQHGIAAVASHEVMKWLRSLNIQLNVCPTSNVVLQRVECIACHPIRQLFDAGIKLTVNSDDILLFDQTVSEEFLTLYQHKVFSAAELNQIRMNGFSSL